GPGQLAACCASGDLAGAVEAAERLVGLGPGLVPSGDSVVSGVLLALRLLGGAISGGTRAVWLANWLSAAVTCDAAQRTTTLAASLLHCAAKGQAAAEVSAVLLGIAGHEPDELPPAGAGQLLAPWPNRVDGGRYVFGGTEHQLALTEPARANAIHGLTRWKAWTVIRQDASAVLLRSAPHGQQGYPFCLESDAEYRLDAGDGLHVAITARNRGSRAAPYGTGSHPYLTVRAPSVDGCELTVPAQFWLPTDDRGIPSGPPAAVEGT